MSELGQDIIYGPTRIRLRRFLRVNGMAQSGTVAAIELNVTPHTIYRYRHYVNQRLLTAESCLTPCIQECEVGLVHCRNYHLPVAVWKIEHDVICSFPSDEHRLRSLVEVAV